MEEVAPILCTSHMNSRISLKTFAGGKLISPKIQIPCDSLNRVSQEPQDLQELRASRAFMATPAPPAHRGTEGFQVCLGCRARR